MRKLFSLLLGISLVVCLAPTAAASGQRGDQQGTHLGTSIGYHRLGEGNGNTDQKDGISDIDVFTIGRHIIPLLPPGNGFISLDDGRHDEKKGGESTGSQIAESLLFIWLSLL